MNDSKANVESIGNLLFTTGGLERFLWLPTYLDQSTKNVNLLFAYDGHEANLERLNEGEVVEVTSREDLWATQLPTEKFVFPADNLKIASPHINWSKLILSGHDWEHASKHHKNENHKFF